MAWDTMCMKCWQPFDSRSADDPLGSMSCTDCPHCGNHSCGAEQLEGYAPCTQTGELLPVGRERKEARERSST